MTAPPSIADAAVTPAEDATAFVEAWSKTTNAHDTAALRALYGDDVRFYGARLPRDTCIAKLQAYFSKHATATQTIGRVTFDVADAGGVTRASFTKTVVEKGAKHDYACHLDLARLGSRWVIVGESDATTDMNLAKANCQDLEWTIYEMWTGGSGQTEADLTGTITLARRIVDGGTRDYFRFALDKPVCPDTRVRIPNYDGDTSVGRLGRITGYTPCGEVCGGPSFDSPVGAVEVFKAAAFVGAKVRVHGTLHIIHDPPLGHDLLYVSADGSAEKLVFADDAKIERL